MAIQHNVAGPVIVTFDAVELGYARDGVRIEFHPRWLDVHSDDFGGEAGAPSDAQMMGGIAIVTAELTKYDHDFVKVLTSFEESGATGTFPAFGTLVKQGGLYSTLLLNGANQDWTFAQAFLRRAQDVNVGTKFSTFMLGWECWVNTAAARVLMTIA